MSEKMTPEIRFRGFQGEWEKILANDIFGATSDKNHPELPVLSASQVSGMIRRDESNYEVYHDPKNENTYKRVLPGQFVIHLRSFQGGFAHSSIEGITSPAYTVMTFKNKEKHNDIFWKYVFISEDFIKRLELITYGIRDGRSISFEEFTTLFMICPNACEQKRIGSLFAALDRTIDLQRRKLEKLQTFKSSMLQKMFPKEGSLTPEIRFSGFEGEWKHISFGEAFSLLSNNTLSRADLNYENGDFLNVHYGDVLIKFNEILNVSKDELPYITDSFNSDKIRKAQLQNGDVVIADTAEDETVGKAVEIADILNTPVVSGLHTIPCRPIIQFAPKYLGFYLNSPSFHNQLIPLMQGIKVTSISKSALSDTYVLYPHNLREQERIGMLLDQLNFKIAFLSKKLTKLQNLKQSLLQKMFV